MLRGGVVSEEAVSEKTAEKGHALDARERPRPASTSQEQVVHNSPKRPLWSASNGGMLSGGARSAGQAEVAFAPAELLDDELLDPELLDPEPLDAEPPDAEPFDVEPPEPEDAAVFAPVAPELLDEPPDFDELRESLR